MRLSITTTAAGAFIIGLLAASAAAAEPEPEAMPSAEAGAEALQTVPSRCVEYMRETYGIIRGRLGGRCSTVHYPDGEYARYYGFTLYRTEGVTIEMDSYDVDAWLALREGPPPGSRYLLEEDDDGGRGTNSRIITILPAGNYTIEATTAYPGETGRFTLRFVVH